ncbi:FtsX-like permease family protein [bacterium]|nr:FtsX-like permease family protein [bacterium]
MNSVALKMLFGDTAKYIGIVMGLTFASLLMTQQMSIFVGLMSRTFGFISDTGLPDIWVMDPKVQFVDDLKPMQDTQLQRVRSVEGVEWAMPLYKGLLKARLDDGGFQTCNVVGLDDATLIGGPPVMVEGRLEDLRRADSVIVDIEGATDKLAKQPDVPGGPKRPLRVGDTLEINDKRAIVVGISRGTRTFLSQPTVYTTYSRAITYAPSERKMMSFVLAKAEPGVDPMELCERITATTGLQARTRDEFKLQTVGYFLKNTGIPINFGITVVLGFIVGMAIAGQTFFNFTQDNLRHFGTLKAMGATNLTLLRMILLQALVVGLVGYGLGVGLAAAFGYLTEGGNAAFRLMWQVLAISFGAIAIITMLSAMLSIIKVVRLEPAIVFKG